MSKVVGKRITYGPEVVRVNCEFLNLESIHLLKIPVPIHMK